MLLGTLNFVEDTDEAVAIVRAELARFFDGLDLVEPGLVSCTRWRPGPDDPDLDVPQFCGVGRKP